MSGVINFYQTIGRKYANKQRRYANYDKVHIQLPLRAAIIGKSGSGKNICLTNLIFQMACFTKIMIIAKDLEQPLMKFIIDEYRAMEKKLDVDILTTSDSLDDLPEIEFWSKDENNLVVFDDIINESAAKLKKIGDYFSRSRNQNVSPIVLSQSYHALPKI